MTCFHCEQRPCMRREGIEIRREVWMERGDAEIGAGMTETLKVRRYDLKTPLTVTLPLKRHSNQPSTAAEVIAHGIVFPTLEVPVSADRTAHMTDAELVQHFIREPTPAQFERTRNATRRYIAAIRQQVERETIDRCIAAITKAQDIDRGNRDWDAAFGEAVDALEALKPETTGEPSGKEQA